MKRIIEKLKRRRQRYLPTPPTPRWWPYVLVVINLILISFFVLDGPVGAYAVKNPNPLILLGETFTDLGLSGWILAASALLFFEALAVIPLARGLKARFEAMVVSHIAFYIFVSVAASGLISNLVKRIVGRARPVLFEDWGYHSFFHVFSGSRFESFPSGHSTTIGATMMALALLAPRYRLTFLIVGLWTATLRVIVNAHYPSDVIGGVAFGAWFSLFMAIVFSRYGILFRQQEDGMPVLRRAVPFVLKPDWATRPLPPRGAPAKRKIADQVE